VAQYTANVIGAGPNGLAAAIELARAGWSVIVYEAADTIGGGLRTAELTLPGFKHDVCSAIHPLSLSSPFFVEMPFYKYGVEWIHPEISVAHPFDDGTAAELWRSFEETAYSLGVDGKHWERLMQPFVRRWHPLMHDILSPLRIPKHPFLMAWFGLNGLQSARGLANRHFDSVRARSLFAGIAAHAMLPLEKMLSASFGIVLAASAHAVGWPLPRGGSQAIANAMAGCLQDLGGKIVTNHKVENIDELPQATATLFDLTPRQIIPIAGHRLPDRYVRALQRYRYGGGVFKVDWALSEPVPWKAEACRKAGTVHLGGTIDEIATSERMMWNDQLCDKPYILVAQQSLFDSSRAPEGQHTLWTYCHVPAYSEVDMTEHIMNQIERFAPGFRDIVLAKHAMNAKQVEAYNANYIGGDINGGLQDIRQLFTRPTVRIDPYSTPAKDIFICSSSTPPGGGVHGMCGYHAAQSVLRRFK
jgi:phytoene dehydrogenase-like protein